MSFQAMAWAIEQKTATTTQKMLLMCIANYADNQGRCFPSHALLAEEAICSVRTVVTALSSLEKAGFISREQRRRKDGTQTSDFIIVNRPVKQSAMVAPGKGIRVQMTAHQSAMVADHEPITEPITKEGENGHGKRADSERMVRGFQSLSAQLGKVIGELPKRASRNG